MEHKNHEDQLSFDFCHEIPNRQETPSGLTERISRLFQEVFDIYRNRSRKNYPIRHIHISFHPYKSLKYTIRVKGTSAYVRIAKFANGQPDEFFEGLAHRMWSDMYGMKCHPEILRKFNEENSRLHRRLDAAGTFPETQKRFVSQGNHHDLQRILSKVSRLYFQHAANDLRIGWSLRKAVSRLGHYDSRAGMIMISGMLDDPEVPGYVVEYIVYHEILHHIIPAEPTPKGKRNHGWIFRQNEKKYPEYCKACNWLKNSYPALVRNIRKKTFKSVIGKRGQEKRTKKMMANCSER